jgi:hypothetical protein
LACHACDGCVKLRLFFCRYGGIPWSRGCVCIAASSWVEFFHHLSAGRNDGRRMSTWIACRIRVFGTIIQNTTSMIPSSSTNPEYATDSSDHNCGSHLTSPAHVSPTASSASRGIDNYKTTRSPQSLQDRPSQHHGVRHPTLRSPQCRGKALAQSECTSRFHHA